MDEIAHDASPSATFRKAPTGIAGLDEITLGDLPRERVSLVCGGVGVGKSLLAMQFLVAGATEFAERGGNAAYLHPDDPTAKSPARSIRRASPPS